MLAWRHWLLTIAASHWKNNSIHTNMRKWLIKTNNQLKWIHTLNFDSMVNMHICRFCSAPTVLIKVVYNEIEIEIEFTTWFCHKAVFSSFYSHIVHYLLSISNVRNWILEARVCQKLFSFIPSNSHIITFVAFGFCLWNCLAMYAIIHNIKLENNTSGSESEV